MDNTKRYSWYEVDFTSFLLSFELPAYREDMSVDDVLKKEQRNFTTAFNDMVSKNKFRFFSDKFYSRLKKELTSIKDVFNLLIEIVNTYNNADLAGAQSSFNDLMAKLKDYLLIENIFWPEQSSRLFRIRNASNEKLKEPYRMFHISYKKRYLITNERYSLAGSPSLYLSSQLYTAWQECGYPNKFYYSEFKCQKEINPENEWNFIIFMTPRKIANTWFVTSNESEDYYFSLANAYLHTYPLIFACSVVNPNGKSAFKPEYIIPQLLMQWIYRNYSLVKGVKYFSCYNTDDIRLYNGFNLAIPAKNFDKSGYSIDLARKFKLSQPILKGDKGDFDKMAAQVHKYKGELIRCADGLVPEVTTCLWDMFRAADLLDKALRHTDDSNMNFIMSTLRTVERYGDLILEEYDKFDIINNCIGSIAYRQRMESQLQYFSRLFDEFNANVIEIAEKFGEYFNTTQNLKNEDFYNINDKLKKSRKFIKP